MTAHGFPTISEAFATDRAGFSGLTAPCPHCGTIAAFKGAGATGGLQQNDLLMGGKKIQNILVGSCPSCRQIVVGVHLEDRRDNTVSTTASLIWPLDLLPNRAPVDVEADIAKPYHEARTILSLSPMGAAVLARRCIQHILRQRLKVTHRRLFEEIQEATSRPELTKPTREALDHVRMIGNWGAHPTPDKSDPATTIIDVTSEEARYTLEVVELLFNDLYAVPARIQAMKERITRRR